MKEREFQKERGESTALQPRKISPPDTSDDPIDHKQGPRPGTDLLVPINAPPSIHRHQTSHQLVFTEIKYGSVTNIRKGTQMQIPEGLGYSLVVGEQWCDGCASQDGVGSRRGGNWGGR